MKKIILTLFSLLVLVTYSQEYDSQTITLSSTPGLNITLRVQTNASDVTITATGPSDRWYSIGFGTQNMNNGDCLIFSNTGISDRHFNGNNTPVVDSNDWNVISNITNGGVRTIVASRSLSTATPTLDFTFNNSLSTIPVVWARSETPTFSLAYHGNTNRGFNSINTTLSSKIFTLQEIKLFPNPALHQLNVVIPDSIDVVDYQIFDLNGKKISSGTISKLENTVDVTTLNKGMYLIYLNHAEYGSLTKTWVKN